MSGEDMAYGAVGAAPGIKNPIAAATALLYKGKEGLTALGRVPPLVRIFACLIGVEESLECRRVVKG